MISSRYGKYNRLKYKQIKRTAMCNFIEDYTTDPAQAIMSAKALADKKFEDIVIDDELIWRQLGSPEFRLYEEIALS